ncbi:M16 family metallopeptidase [Salegentibacter mishustinae]|uniref:Peptidase M16 n=1 Tax=Salegentibacter mishustinae TaxID=270918 RepID=A0A0Q9ZBV8_9FLAO|nr:M16 family metallopeptidase [Salegentibacter mishustinae]KRG30540.1 peptidase M16 [Salegentibacter mishustinae]PZX66498.1 zinc protease [Salegentibacter mishustinae]GGW82881.1 zinc protease [Salegentibacter mishustinae]
MKKYFSLLMCGLLGASGFSQSLDDILEKQEIPLNSDIKIGKLENGLTYYIKENKEPQERAELYLAIKAGSLQENDDQKGLAHFTEHMAFNGTESFPKNELINYLQKAGIRFGADLNAYTGFDRTVYQLPLPTDDEALFESGFKILSEWAGAISFEAEEINNEREVIVEEERQRGKNVSERISKQLLPVLLKDSRYEDRLPIGEVEIIRNFDHQTLKDYYKDWYRPHLQAVIAVGDFDKDKVEALIKENFSDLKTGENPKKPEIYSIPSNKEPLVKIVTDPEYPYTVASLMYKHPGTSVKTDKDFRNSIMRSAVNSMLSARIQETTQAGNAPFLQAGASYGAYQGGMGDLDAFSIQVVAKTPETLEPAVKGIMDEVLKMKTFGFTQSELDRTKLNFKRAVEQSYKEKDKTASKVYVNQILSNFLKGEAVIDMEYSMDFYNKYLDGITLEEVNQMAIEFIRDDNQIILLQAAESSKEQLPDEATLTDWFLNYTGDFEAYQDEISSIPLLDKELSTAGITSKKKIKELDATEITLENGIKVILKSTDFKSDQVLFQAFSPGGYSLATEDLIQSAKIADNLIASSGIGEFNAIQLKKKLAGKSLSLSPYISTYTEGIKGKTSSDDLETLLKLTYLYFTEPRKDSLIFQNLKDNYKVAIEGKSSNPVAVFQDTINTVMRGKGPWALDPEVDDIENFSLDQAYKFYQSRFRDAGDFTFVFVGNFQNQEVIPHLKKYLGSLPSTGSKEKFKDVGIAPIQGKVNKEIKKGLEEKAMVVLTYHDTYKHNQKNNLQLKAIKSALETRLLKRLREKESGVYSPSVGLSIVKIPNPYYTFSISFNSAPDRADELIEATKEEVDRMIEDGPYEEELQKFIAQEKRQKELQLRSNSYWLSYIKGVYSKSIKRDYINQYEDYLDKLKPRNLKNAAKKYLSVDGQAQLILLPQD